MYTAIVICACLASITFFLAIAARQDERETRIAEVDNLLNEIFNETETDSENIYEEA